MRILILNIQYYPIGNPNVYRWSAIAEYWAQLGHEVHVLCSKTGEAPIFETINGVNIHRAGHNTLLDWTYNVLRIKKRRGIAGNSPSRPVATGRRFIEKLVDWTWRKIYWPDGSCLWYFPAVTKAIKLNKQEPFDAVISVGLPFTAHLAGKKLKKTFPGIKWHMDIEDPFAYSKEFFVNNSGLYNKINIRAEKKAFELADTISVTVARAKEKYTELFPGVSAKISLIPPLFNLQVSQRMEELFSPGYIHLSYFGTFYQNVRPASPLLLIIKELTKTSSKTGLKLKFHFFGEINPNSWKDFEGFEEIFDCIEFHGLVSREKVASLIRQSGFLINIGNTTDYHLPSKSVDYLMSRKPIINLCLHENDTTKAFLKNYPLILNVACYRGPVSKEGINALASFIAEKNGIEADEKIIKTLGKPYHVDRIAEQYINLIK